MKVFKHGPISKQVNITGGPVSINTPEHPPTKGVGEGMWLKVCDDVKAWHPDGPIREAFLRIADERHLMGVQKYGTPLFARNGRNPMRDAVQESADKVVYLRQAVEEGWPVEEYYRREVADCMALIAILDQFKVTQ